MAPANNDRHPNHTGTIPKTKVRNNCNVPQEAVTPTRRDMTTNLVSTSLDWVPVSEYNSRSNYNQQSRKQTNNTSTSDQELNDLDNSVTFESGFGRFVPVRPQPRVLPLNVQNRDNLTTDNHDDAGSSVSGHTLHPYAHQMQNGLIAHTNHAAAAIMIVNPTTPNAVTGNISQPFNAPNQNRNNLTRNLNSARNNIDSHASNNNSTPPSTSQRSKTVNLMNNMYDQSQGSHNNLNENNHIHRESARALGEAIVASCPDAAAVERRLGQIREYIRVTSSLVDTMRNSEDEQDVVVRPVSAQSNGSAYSDNELWQNEIKNKMELSQMRLAALKQQQKRLLKYQEEAKQQLDELHRERQSQENIQPSTSHENFSSMQNPSFSGNYHNARMYAANQIGVATTLPHSTEHQSIANNIESERNHSAHSTHSHDDRFSHHVNVASSEEAGGGTRESDNEEDEALLTDRGRDLQMKLRELQLKKQHMENLVSEFQKLQMVTRLPSSHNTYSSSGEESADEGPSRKCNKSSGNMKNEDPFKLMEIKAIKTALQKTKDLMRSVENYEVEQGLSGSHDDPFQIPSHSNIHDNKSEGGGSMGGWSNDGSLCRVRNSLPQRHKFTNEQHSQQTQQHSQQSQHIQQSQQQMQQLQQHVQQLQQHVQNQQQHAQNQQQHVQNPQIHAQQHPHQQQNHEANLASLQELAQELRMETEKIMNERARIKDMVSNKEIARKQKKVNEEVRPSTNGQAGPAERRQQQLRALLADKQRELQALLHKEVLCSSSEVQNPKPDSRTASVVNQSYTSEQEPDSRSEQILMDSQTSRENENFRTSGDSALGARSINTLPSHLGSNYDSDSDSASRNNQRNRARRRQERISNDNNVLLTQSNNSNQNLRHEPRPESSNVNLVPPIAQSSDTPTPMQYPHVPPPWNTSKSNQDMRTNQFTQNSHSQTMERLLGTPQMSFPPSMPYNMMLPYAGMLGGGCACGCGVWGAWCWQQVALQQREIHQLRDQLNHLEERWRAENASHMLNNQVPPGNRANNYWDNFRSYSRQNLLSANSKTNADSQPSTSAGPPPAPAAPALPAAFRHITNPIPDPPHACNLNKRKSSTKLPAKNSRRNAPDRANLNLAAPNPNLASTSRDLHDKATSKLFDLLRENVYSEVTALIGVNESHPDFLIQLFRELQHISSDPLRQRVLQSIRGVLTQYGTTAEVQADIQVDESAPDEVTTTSVEPGPYQHGPLSIQNACAVQVDNKIVRFLLMRSEEVFTAESLEDLAALILNTADGRQSQQSRKQLLEMLAKYEGMRVCDASNDIVENLPLLTSGNNEGDESTQHTELTENSMLQDVAGSLNLFSASDTQLHQISCPYDMWPGHVHMDIEEEIGDSRPHSSQEGKVDLINCSEMQNGELAEADQTCREEGGGAGPAAGAGELPDVVDADEATPTEAEAEWLGLDRVPTRLHMEKSSGNQKD